MVRFNDEIRTKVPNGRKSCKQQKVRRAAYFCCFKKQQQGILVHSKNKIFVPFNLPVKRCTKNSAGPAAEREDPCRNAEIVEF